MNTKKIVISIVTFSIIIVWLISYLFYYAFNTLSNSIDENNISAAKTNIGINNTNKDNNNINENTTTTLTNSNVDLVKWIKKEEETNNINIRWIVKEDTIISNKDNLNKDIFANIETNNGINNNAINNNSKNVNIFISTKLNDESYLDNVSKYLDKGKLILKDDYKFIPIKSRNLWDELLCQYWYKEFKKYKKFWIFHNSEDIVFWEIIKNFNNNILTSYNKNLNKYYIIVDENLNINCNSIEILKEDIDNIWKDNSNIYILYKENKNNIINNFYDKLSIYTGVNVIKYNSDIDLRNKLNDYINPIENKLELNNNNSKTKSNVLISFFDENNNEYQWNLKIFKKVNWIFKLISEDIYTKEYKDNLDSWIYKFVAYDNLTWIELDTWEVSINIVNNFEHKFLFRKTKLKLYIYDELNKPIKWNFIVKYIWKKETKTDEYKETSSVILNAIPWEYNISIKTSNGYFFDDIIRINWEKENLKIYKTIKKSVLFQTVDQNNIKLNNVLIKVIKEWKIIDAKKWNNIEMLLPVGKYTIEATDVNSGNSISKNIEIWEIQNNDTKNIKLELKSYPVILNMWRKWYIVNIYKNNDNIKMKTISWTWTKKILLGNDSFKLEVLDTEWNFIKNMNIEVDSFFENRFDIAE